ncbi:hypothetical protein PHYBOEH_010510 [Phytophthora boehmeriae]|uniref:Uncharacterized protein n=1 Tax=Phytophthora boehmeriae TaxID=109152 RepID=A0A8T1WY04_9STRA|nr:hypothetical protein PHYBOEH_010510 [Phytophthora boehmeriae]
MNDPNLPQCLSTVRLHEMLLDGTLGEREVRALEMDLRLGWKYRSFRSCDDAFRALVGLSQRQGDATDTDQAPEKPPQLLYAEYLYCTSGVLCEKSLQEWGACVKSLQTGEKEIGECAQAKRLLERCLRGKTEELLRASQPQVFRPNSTS